MPDEIANGGHEAELSQAATRMANAITNGNAEELRLAASDHAAALGSQASAMAASIATVLIEHMNKALSPVVQRLDKADSASLDWRVDLRTHLDQRFDAYGKELDELKGGLARLYKSEDAIIELRAFTHSNAQRLDRLEQLGRDDTTAAILVVSQRIETLEQQHKALLLRLEQRNE